MAEFINPFSGVTPDRKMTAREVTRGIRLALSAEQEAVHLYEALADATDNPLVREVLQDVANEERVHAGEFLRLLQILLPDEAGFLAEGAAEVDAEAAPSPAAGQAPQPKPAPGGPTVGGFRK